jgi:hypothetical protein
MRRQIRTTHYVIDLGRHGIASLVCRPANICQYELVKLLVTGVGKKSMLATVGDDDQTLHASHGATIEYARLPIRSASFRSSVRDRLQSHARYS